MAGTGGAIGSNISIGQRMLIVMGVFIMAFIVIIIACTVFARKSKANALLTKNEFVKFALLAKNIEINVVQVQQWLTDISATRGLPGFNDPVKKR